MHELLGLLPPLPMAAAGYFALLLTAILAFSPFAPLPLARAGLFFAAGLAATLTILSPEWCGVCLFAHACHLSAWGVLVFFQEKKEREGNPFRPETRPPFHRAGGNDGAFQHAEFFPGHL